MQIPAINNQVQFCLRLRENLPNREKKCLDHDSKMNLTLERIKLKLPNQVSYPY